MKVPLRACRPFLFILPLITILGIDSQARATQNTIVGHEDLRLCMTFGEFRAGAMWPEFSNVKIEGNAVMPPLVELRRIGPLEPVGGRASTSVWFGPGARLDEIRIRIPPYLARPQRLRDGATMYAALAEHLRRSYAIRPDGPILAVESELFGDRQLLLIDPQGNTVSLQYSWIDYSMGTDEFVQLSYFARGSERSPARRAATVLLGREIGFCEGD